MILRKGLFTKVDEGLTSDEVYVWRKVLDEMLIAMISTNTSARDHSIRWFNSEPGDEDYYVIDNPDDPDYGIEFKTDMYEEFAEVCSLANLEPDTVRNAANKVYDQLERK